MVVTIEDIEKGKPFEFTETKLEANICQFVPFVSVMREHHLLTVKNLDPVSHDLQIYERDREHVFIMFHRPALTKSGTSDIIRFHREPPRASSCNAACIPSCRDTDLPSRIRITRSPVWRGPLTIKDLPAGTYRIKAWHPTLGEKVQDVTVAANGTTSLGFSFEAK